MQAYEFSTNVTLDGRLIILAMYARHILSGDAVRLEV
jgi:hypothetical protein